MTIFDFFRSNQRRIAKPARPASKSPGRFLGAHFEWLEPRCLLSVVPPAQILDEPASARYASLFVAPLAPRADGQNFSDPQPAQQFQLPAAEDPASGITILNGMSNLGDSSFSRGQAIPNAATDGLFNLESHAVRLMLASLQYVPLSPPPEITQQPTILPAAPAIAPPFATLAPPLPGNLLSSPGSLPALPSSAPSLPSSSPSALARTESSPSSPPSNFRSEPTVLSNSSPASGSADALGHPGPQHDSEGGMVTLVRQPVVQPSTVDKFSVAAIDRLLETPAKVDGMQGRFQAFEISVTIQTPLPATPPAAGAPTYLPVESTNATTPPAAAVNLRSARVTPDSAGPVPPLNLSSEEFSSASFSAAFPTAATRLPENCMPRADLPRAVDAVFGELSSEASGNSFATRRLDIAAATLLALVIGRALWPTRVSNAAEQEKPLLRATP